MARIRRRKIEMHQAAVAAVFDAAPRRVYTHGALQRLLDEELREFVGVSMSTDALIGFLTKESFLKTADVRPPLEAVMAAERPSASHYTRYIWREASPYELGLSLAARSYLSHGSAVFLHGLTDAIPSRIYVNREQASTGAGGDSELQQAAINRAFSNKQRQTTAILMWENWEFALLNGKNTGRLEVAPLEFENIKLAATRIERTLIDITVRPTYAGGVYEVLNAYRGARGRISPATLLATLKQLDYAYPYHQAIGFYLERAGFDSKDYERFRSIGLEYDFFLAHDIREREFIKEWRLHVPKGF